MNFSFKASRASSLQPPPPPAPLPSPFQALQALQNLEPPPPPQGGPGNQPLFVCGTECHSASAAVDQLHTAFQSLGSRLSVATLADGVLHCAPHPATLSVVRHTVVLDGGHPCVCLRCNFRFDGHRADHVLFALPSLAWISSLLVCFRARIKSHAAPTDHKNQFFLDLQLFVLHRSALIAAAGCLALQICCKR